MTDLKCFCTIEVTPREVLAENLAYLCKLCSVLWKKCGETGQVEDKKGSSSFKKHLKEILYKVDKPDLKVMSLRNLVLQLTHLLLTGASIEMVSVEGWLSTNHS